MFWCRTRCLGLEDKTMSKSWYLCTKWSQMRPVNKRRSAKAAIMSFTWREVKCRVTARCVIWCIGIIDEDDEEDDDDGLSSSISSLITRSWPLLISYSNYYSSFYKESIWNFWIDLFLDANNSVNCNKTCCILSTNRLILSQLKHFIYEL